MGRVITIVFLALTSLAGISNAVNEVGAVESALQASVEFGDALWGVLGLLAAIGVWRRSPWTLTVAAAWSLTVVYTATVASFSFSDPTFKDSGTVIGTIAAGVSTALVTGLIVWAARVFSRPLGAAPATPATPA